MIAISILVALTVFGFFLCITAESSYENRWFIGACIASIGAVFLFVALIAIPLNHVEIRKRIAAFEATRATITASAGVQRIENAALIQSIVEHNAWLAGVQYDNAHFFDIWVPDEIDTIEPLYLSLEIAP